MSKKKKTKKVLTDKQRQGIAEELNNSKPFDVHKWSEYKEVNDTVDYLYPKILKKIKVKQAPSAKQVEIKKRHLKVIILDLWACYLQDPKMYVAYSRSPNKYLEVNSRYNSCHISYKTIDIVDALVDLKYAKGGKNNDKLKGYYNDIIGKGHFSRMIATKKLTDMIGESCSPGMIESAPTRECIILRDSNKKPVKYGDGESIKEPRKIKIARQHLCDYNNLLRHTHIDIPYFPEDGIPTKDKDRNIYIDYSRKFVRKIFNNESWEEGGRYHGGWWQGIPNNDFSGFWREKIRLDCWPTIELDYSALHIILCYALKGIDYYKTYGEDADPYYIPQYDHIYSLKEKGVTGRDFIKEVLLTTLNCRNEDSACRVVIKLLRTGSKYHYLKDKLGWKNLKFDTIKPFLKSLRNHHKPIDEFIHKGKGRKLQYADSRVADMVINEFVMVDQPILCIHDSFIVKKKDFTDLLYQMKKAYLKVVNENKGGRKNVLTNPPKIKYDESESVIDWLGVGNPITNRKNNQDRFDEVVKKPFRDKKYRQRWIRFNQIKKVAKKEYYKPI